MFKKIAKQPVALVLLLSSTLGLIASTVLSYDALILAKNKDAILSCDINAVISCASVANHWSSAVFFGIPNSFFGMIAMPVIMTIAVAMLSGVKFPKWFMRSLHIGTVAGLVFAGWMFYMSLAVIGVLCPWCLTFDAVLIIMFFCVTRYAIESDVWPFNKKVDKKLKKFAKGNFDLLVMFSVIVLLFAIILAKYGSELFA